MPVGSKIFDHEAASMFLRLAVQLNQLALFAFRLKIFVILIGNYHEALGSDANVPLESAFFRHSTLQTTFRVDLLGLT